MFPDSTLAPQSKDLACYRVRAGHTLLCAHVRSKGKENGRHHELHLCAGVGGWVRGATTFLYLQMRERY